MSKRRGRNAGGRRSYLKRFSSEFVNAGRINRNLNQYSQGQFRRGQYTVPPKSTYQEQAPRIGAKLERTGFLDTVLARLAWEWQSDFWQGKQEWHRQTIVEGGARQLYLFFSGDRAFYVAEYLEALPGQGIIQGTQMRSMVYLSLETARMAYQYKNIKWLEKRIPRN